VKLHCLLHPYSFVPRWPISAVFDRIYRILHLPELIKTYNEIKKGNQINNSTEGKKVCNVNFGRLLGRKNPKPAGSRNLQSCYSGIP